MLEDSALVGSRWSEGPAKKEKDMRLVQVIRKGKATSRASRTSIRKGDVLLLHGNVDNIIGVQEEYGLKLMEDARKSKPEDSSDEVRLLEALVPPGSLLVDKTFKGAGLKRRFGCSVIAIQRGGEILRKRLEEVKLDSGDSLLLQGSSEDVARLLKSEDLIVTNELTDLYLRRDRAAMAHVLMLAVVGLAALNVLPIMTAAIVGAVGMVLAGCLTIEEAYQAIDWKVIFLLGGIIPLGLAIDQTGAAAWLAKTVLQPSVGFGPLVVLAALYITTAMLTETMSDNAAAVLLAPIAISLATAMEIDPRPFLMAITFAASTSFATPVGYKTNTMIFAPGGYRFLDYTKVGGPLNLVFWVIAVLLIPVIWPF